jgi:hypothetical protein
MMMPQGKIDAKTGFIIAARTIALSIAVGGCYYPANIRPPSEAKTRIVINVPYDLTWDAVHTVVKDNDYKLQGDDPNDGIVEAEAHQFTLDDADCGQMRSIGSKYPADPMAGGSAVYNFKVGPAGPEATNLSVTATFSTPLHIPLHPVTDFQCVSRGIQEARLIDAVETAALRERRPGENRSAPTPPPSPREPLKPGRPTLLSPGFFKKPGS